MTYMPWCGDIGEPLKRIELEPFPDEVPVAEPAAPPVEAPEPVKVPV